MSGAGGGAGGVRVRGARVGGRRAGRGGGGGRALPLRLRAAPGAGRAPAGRLSARLPRQVLLAATGRHKTMGAAVKVLVFMFHLIVVFCSYRCKHLWNNKL